MHGRRAAQLERLERARVRLELDATVDACADAAERQEKGGRALVDGDAQPIGVALDGAVADARPRLADAGERALTVLAHDPGALFALIVQGEVDGDVLFGARRLAAPEACRVIGRKYAADEEDGGERARAVVTDGVEIPPGVAAGRHVAVRVHGRAYIT
jgi:hypothetical protein